MPILAVLIGILAFQDDEPVRYGYVIVRPPAGWTSEAKPESLFLKPGDLAEDQNYVAMVMPGQRSTGTLEEGLDRLWKQTAGSAKLVNKAPPKEIKTEGGTNGLLSVGILETDLGTRLLVAAAVFKPGDRIQPVLAMTSQDGTFQEYIEAFRDLLKGLRFRNIELPPYELIVAAAPGKESFVLFRDGSSLALLPKEGMDGFRAAAARKEFEAFWGTHETRDGVLTLKGAARSDTLHSQPDGSYRAKDKDGKEVAWLRASSAIGLRFDGRYRMTGNASLFTFKPDGQFEDGGLGVALAPDAPGERPSTGAGKGGYEIMDNSLYLAYEDGRRRKLSFVATWKVATDRNPDLLRIAGLWLERVPQ